MKRNLLLVLIICVILALSACGARATVDTAAGKFELSQGIMEKITDNYGNELAASAGNTLLVIYLTPADDNIVTEDDAYNYFYSGTKAQVDGQVYDMKCISLEKVGEKVRYGLVFEIVNNGYNDQNKPVVQLSPPQSLPQLTPKPTATPLPTPAVSSVPAPTQTVDPEESPEVSPEET